MTLMSNYVPKVDEDVILNEKNYKVYRVKHIINQEPSVVEKFVVTLHKKRLDSKFQYP